MITRDLRRAIARAVAAAGHHGGGDPGLRPTGTPGQYAASVALALGGNPRETAETLAGALAREPWIRTAEVTGPGYLTVTITPEALAAVADNVAGAGPACVTSDALAGRAVPAAAPGDPLTAPTWEEARAALAARLTARLAAAAGATVSAPSGSERGRVSPPSRTDRGAREDTGRSADSPQRAAAFAGPDAVLFSLARAIPGRPLRIDPQIIARHVVGNPAYAVRYAHARAASGVRWAVASSSADTIGVAEAAALLDALSWLPERVAAAARRGRPDEFARYLEDLASVTIDVLSSVSHPRQGGPSPAGHGRASRFDRLPSASDREPRSGGTREAKGAGSNPSGADEVSPGLGEAEEGALSREPPPVTAGRVRILTLATAARTGLAAALSLLEVSAPERLLANRHI